MDTNGYKETITIKESLITSELISSTAQLIKATIAAATTGMCRNVLSKLDITETNGTILIPPIEGWAGSSITMCSCKPQVEVNLLQIPNIKNIVWSNTISNFEDCASSGNLIMESYPRQCLYNNQTYTENIGNELEKMNLISIETPRPNEIISSPLIIKGQARGNWFFEASFPVFITNWDGKIIASGIANAKDDWMTSEYVPFEANLTFIANKNSYNNKATLILKKDNPSGLSENDDALEIPVLIE